MTDLIELRNWRQQLNIDTLLHQGHVLLRPVIPNAQVLLASLEHNLEWFLRKALLGHALNASYLKGKGSIRIDFLYSFGEDIEAFGRISIIWNKHELEV